jgi:hypothetical protein
VVRRHHGWVDSASAPLTDIETKVAFGDDLAAQVVEPLKPAMALRSVRWVRRR